MRILFLQPEDLPSDGPWARERWDLIVDLGRSSQFSAEAWSRSGFSVLRSESFRGGIADLRRLRDIFSVGRGRLVDEEGIDWWNLTSLCVEKEALTVLAMHRLASEINATAELWATRPAGPAAVLAILLKRPIRSFRGDGAAGSRAVAFHYAGLARRFSPAQIKEIFLDKYDSGYRWRRRITMRRRTCAEPVVLVPSAYGNVSRMASNYARLLPQQNFLTVATRQSGRQFVSPPNMQLRNLAEYAKGDAPAVEISSVLDRWTKFKADMSALPELLVLSRTGVLDPISNWIRDGLSVREAWREVVDHEPVCGVLCGDDSNLYTLLPVLLAARRKIPTVDFHHGAFDGRYLLKELPCEVYLAKNEMERDYLLRVCGLPMERVVICAPSSQSARPVAGRSPTRRTSMIFFSEPYEAVGMRAEEVYRELMPPLCRLAATHGRGLIVKLHPFESRSQRRELIRNLLTPKDRELVTVVDGPLTDELMTQAWFGITVESTTVIDCLKSGIPCFLCRWLILWPFEYGQQYARFGVGEALQSAEQIADIPSRLAAFENQSSAQAVLMPTVDPVLLQSLLTGARTRGC
jgi:hypothetical protein